MCDIIRDEFPERYVGDIDCEEGKYYLFLLNELSDTTSVYSERASSQGLEAPVCSIPYSVPRG